MIPVIGADFPKKLIPLIDNAKGTIDILMYDWRWYPNQPGHIVQQFNMALVRAIGRGVHIRAIVDKPLLISVFNRVGIKGRLLTDRRTVHSKIIIIDNKLLVIGSHNLTKNAFTSNIESSVIIDLEPDDTRFIEFFNNLYTI